MSIVEPSFFHLSKLTFELLGSCIWRIPGDDMNDGRPIGIRELIRVSSSFV